VTSASQWRDILAEVDRTGGCAHPIRLRGIVLKPGTGELLERGLLVPCKDRRAAVCPSCSRLYQADAWQLVAAGLRGGKGVSPAVARHPQLFVTLTAPSFGAVHSRARSGDSVRPCRPRRAGGRCEHGVPLSCRICHGEDDPRLGEPLCADCFDYPGAVLWNAHVPRLWVRTSRELYRELAKVTSLSTAQLRREVRLSYMKVVEFQRRGLVHLHVVIRADGADGPSTPPPDWLDAALLTGCLENAISRASVGFPEVLGWEDERAAWGGEHDIRELVVRSDGDSRAIAAYIAKYATKTADGSAVLARPIRTQAELERLDLRPHLNAMVRTAWRLGLARELRFLNLRAHAHTFGYPGQFSSKSQRFSTTFAALRGARSSYRKGEGVEDGVLEEAPDYDGEWRYDGRGYDHPESNQLADALFEASARVPRTAPTTSTSSSTNSSATL
jgi:hypothetical protein